jgi:hypothetical protein
LRVSRAAAGSSQMADRCGGPAKRYRPRSSSVVSGAPYERRRRGMASAMGLGSCGEGGYATHDPTPPVSRVDHFAMRSSRERSELSDLSRAAANANRPCGHNPKAGVELAGPDRAEQAFNKTARPEPSRVYRNSPCVLPARLSGGSTSPRACSYRAAPPIRGARRGPRASRGDSRSQPPSPAA